jgi:hypothetical protein
LASLLDAVAAEILRETIAIFGVGLGAIFAGLKTIIADLSHGERLRLFHAMPYASIADTEPLCANLLGGKATQPASQPQHVHLGDDRNRLGGCRCERKQRRSRPLVPGQAALENNWLIDDVAASEVADRHDQACAVVPVAKIELDGIRPSAAVPPFGMCPEPSPIKPRDMPKRARHPARGLSRRRKCRELPKRARHLNRCLSRKKVWPAWAEEAGHNGVSRRTHLNLIDCEQNAILRYLAFNEIVLNKSNFSNNSKD